MLQRTALCLSLAACHGPPPAPPTAVIDSTPDDLCAGDGFATVIELSGRRSAARLSLVPSPPDPDAPPLAYRWRIEGAAHEIVSGALDEAALEVVADGERPLHVTLTVTDVEGGRAETLRTIGLVTPIVCEGACEEGARCIDGVCVEDDPCASDADCGCFVCDPELSRCVPERP